MGECVSGPVCKCARVSLSASESDARVWEFVSVCAVPRGGGDVLCAGCCWLCAVSCVLLAVCCVLLAVCCVLCAVCCVLCAVCCVLGAVPCAPTQGLTAGVAGALSAVLLHGGQLLVRLAQLAHAAAGGQAGGVAPVRLAAPRETPLKILLLVVLLLHTNTHTRTHTRARTHRGSGSLALIYVQHMFLIRVKLLPGRAITAKAFTSGEPNYHTLTTTFLRASRP